jgi:hypothetical protein
VSVLEKQKRDLLALDLLAAHRDSFAQGRRKRSKKRKLDDDADYYEPTEQTDSSGLPPADEAEEDTPWKKAVGRRGSSRRLQEPATPTTPAKPRKVGGGRGRPRSVKRELLGEEEDEGASSQAMDVVEADKEKEEAATEAVKLE